MGKYWQILGRTPLFAGIEAADLEKMLGCLGAREAALAHGAAALLMGDPPDHIGIVLEGELQVVREDADGGRALLAALWPGDYYGEALACAGVARSPVSVEAVSDARVMRLPFERLMAPCDGGCPFHRTLIGNLATIIAKKNMSLQRRMELLERKSIRERVMLFLRSQMGEAGRPFTVPLNRGEMAAYLAVDRSALSRELARLQDEGVIQYEKSRFCVMRATP